jgi:hypothetical protein
MTDNNENTVVRVTVRDLYVQLQKIQSMVERISIELPDSEARIQDHEIRIRKLEMRMGWIVGGCGLIAAIVPWILGVVV